VIVGFILVSSGARII